MLPSFLMPDSTIFVLWAIFMAVVVCLHSLVFKPTLAILDARKSGTSGRKNEVIHLIDQNRSDLALFEQKMTEARLKAAHAREAIIKMARSEESQIISKARSENDTILEELRSTIAGERAEALMALKQHAQILARQMVDKILERKVA